jgi:light-regulated signal transduction histidine kinase (bacteriophytochrome)
METPIAEARAQIIAGDLPKLHGDRSQLIQLLQNLLENAIKYNESAEPQVRVSARRQGGDWLFSIRDNGIGIDVAHCEQVFEIFHRLHSQHAYPGTGIGLAVCRRIVQRHGGRIWAESRPDGSDFLFTLPQES